MREFGGRKLISIVVPVHNEQDAVGELFARLREVEAGLQPVLHFEHIFVNDGSTDNSFEVLKALCTHHPRSRVIDLAKNFGKELALTAGVYSSRGDAIVTIDADLQHPPELIPQMVQQWRNGVEIVATVRRSKSPSGMVRRFGSKAFYWLLQQGGDVSTVSDTTDFRLIDKKVALAFLQIDERHRMFRGLIDWLGFRKVWLPFEAPDRKHGKQSYTGLRVLKLALTALVSHSTLPLKAVGLLGVLITCLSGPLLAWMLVAERLVSPRFYYTPLAIFVVGNTLLSGVMLCGLGAVAMYIGKIYSEVSRRPLLWYARR